MIDASDLEDERNKFAEMDEPVFAKGKVEFNGQVRSLGQGGRSRVTCFSLIWVNDAFQKFVNGYIGSPRVMYVTVEKATVFFGGGELKIA